jgi:hypothetical protein
MYMIKTKKPESFYISFWIPSAVYAVIYKKNDAVVECVILFINIDS